MLPKWHPYGINFEEDCCVTQIAAPTGFWIFVQYLVTHIIILTGFGIEWSSLLSKQYPKGIRKERRMLLILKAPSRYFEFLKIDKRGIIKSQNIHF